MKKIVIAVLFSFSMTNGMQPAVPSLQKPKKISVRVIVNTESKEKLADFVDWLDERCIQLKQKLVDVDKVLPFQAEERVKKVISVDMQSECGLMFGFSGTNKALMKKSVARLKKQLKLVELRHEKGPTCEYLSLSNDPSFVVCAFASRQDQERQRIKSTAAHHDVESAADVLVGMKRKRCTNDGEKVEIAQDGETPHLQLKRVRMPEIGGGEVGVASQEVGMRHQAPLVPNLGRSEVALRVDIPIYYAINAIPLKMKR